MELVTKQNRLVQVFHIGKDGNTHLMTMSSKDRGFVETVFRYFRLKIFQIQSGSTLQFSKLEFTSANEAVTFQYNNSGTTEIDNAVTSAPSGAGTADDWYICPDDGGGDGGRIGSSGETPNRGLLGVANKCCLIHMYPTNDDPLIITYDLKTKRLDLSIFKKWHWYTSNDTASNPAGSRNMVKFALEVTNDPSGEWTEVDSHEFTEQEKEKAKRN